ncbi:D-isomer specific 2-hydroxyacid dehydrogenase [Dendrothele bispora CBS 962.96]|uniref:D-isomer specific 2-hydroxyacid dehydrogenase n=1 Tax=Dendrothele bispora (strain CBS 962.96) TaxID=1314807 RepID=A0A4S8MX42_DENBC|nr:D-isomer specific 2-hydroxyacid dehydrogenase [Dendrothele bispora CBS 962.96]
MVRVAILDDYQQVALKLADWSPISGQVTVDVFTDTLADEDQIVQRLQPYEIICAMRERTKFPRSVMERLPNLRFLTTTGMMNRAIDLEYAKEKNILVSGTSGGGNATVEHIWALVMAIARCIVTEHNNVKDGNPQWQTCIPIGLSGKTLGLIGVGRLGSATAKVGYFVLDSHKMMGADDTKIAKLFEMKVIGWSPNLTPERAEQGGVEFCPTKEELFKQSDFVSIHMVLSEKTRHLVGAADLALMKPTAILINTSRGPLVDEKALLEVLQNKKIAGAGLDVFDQEPLPLDHPLRKLTNVTLSPHNAYVNDTSYKVWWPQTVDNIQKYLEGKPVRLLYKL